MAFLIAFRKIMKLIIHLFLATFLFIVCACEKKDTPTAAEVLKNNQNLDNDPYSTAVRAKQNTEEEMAVTMLGSIIKVYETQEGTFPVTLNLLIEKNYISSFPPLPEGRKYSYDPKIGRVDVVNASASNAINDPRGDISSSHANEPGKLDPASAPGSPAEESNTQKPSAPPEITPLGN